MDMGDSLEQKLGVRYIGGVEEKESLKSLSKVSQKSLKSLSKVSQKSLKSLYKSLSKSLYKSLSKVPQ